MVSDLFSSLRKAADSLSNGEKTAADVGNAVNNWVKESGEALKEKIDAEFEAAALRLGFVRKSDLETMAKRIAVLENLVASISAEDSIPPKKKVSARKKISVRTKRRVSK